MYTSTALLRTLVSCSAACVVFAGCSADPAGSGRVGQTDSGEKDVESDAGPISDGISGDGGNHDAEETDSRARDTRSSDSGEGDTSSKDSSQSDAPTPDGDAGPSACRSSADCSGNNVCRVERSGSRVGRSCRPPAGNGKVGDSCSKDADCRSNLCRKGKCSKPCSRPVHCQSAGWTCKSTKIQSGSGRSKKMNVCRPAPSKNCHTDGACSGSDRCMATRGSKKVKLACNTPNSSGGTVGDSCTKDADCTHNLCVDGVCTPPCAADSDCSGAPGFKCKSTKVPLGNGNRDSVSICQPPRPCDHPGACRKKEVCYVRRSQTGKAGRCRLPNQGARPPGSVCPSGDSQCETNLCYDGRFRNVCSRTCKNNSDCKSRHRCKSRAISNGSGGTKKVDICVPSAPRKCTRPSCMNANRTCGVAAKPGGTGLESVCLPNSGGLATGNPCSQHSDCNSRLCVNNYCSVPCDNRRDCGNSQICKKKTVTKNGQTGKIELCVTPPPEKCSSTGICSDGVRVCSNLRLGSSPIEAFCRFPNSGNSSSLGNSCQKHSDCRSGLCLGKVKTQSGASIFASVCSVACTSDSQCAPGQICTSLPFRGRPDVAVCAPGCSTTTGCPGSSTCQLNEDRTGASSSLERVCKPSPGSKQLGENCSGNNGVCKSGYCLTSARFRRNHPNDQKCTPNAGTCPTGWGCYRDPGRGNAYYCAEENHRCTRFCQNSTDCTGGAPGNSLTKCGPVRVTIGGTQQMVNACIPK